MKKYILSLVLLMSSIIIYAQATFLSVAGGGTWSNSSTWTVFSGSDADGVPDADDIVFVINTSGNINITSSVAVRDLHVIFNRAGNIRKTGFGGAVTITIHGQLSGDDGAGTPTVPTADVVNDANISFIFDGSNLSSGTTPVITSWGNVATIQNVSFSPSSSATTLYTDSFSIESGGVLTVTNGTLLINNSNTIAGSGTITTNSGTTLSIDGNVSGGSASTNFPTININGAITVGATGYLNANTINLNSGGILNVQNNETNGWWHSTATGPTFTPNVNSTVNYNRGSTQGVAARTYGNLTISSGGAAVSKSLSSSGTLTVQGDLTIGGSTTFNTASATGTFTFQGGVDNDGTLTLSRPSIFNGGGTQTVEGNNQVTFSSTATFSNAMNFDTDVIFSSTVSAGSNNLSFAGDFTNNGAFNSTGTITVDGSTAQSIAGSSNTSFSNLTISNTSSSTATVNGGGSSITGTLTMSANSRLNANGNVTLVSTGTSSSATARVATIPASATVSGNFIYQRYISGAQQWHNVGLPVSGNKTEISDDFPLHADGRYLSRYNEATAGDINQGWQNSSNFTTIDDTRGYSLWTKTANIPNTIDFTGALNTGNVSLAVSYTDDAGQPLSQDGWNLVNNPYASQIDWGSGSWTKTRIDATAYVWTPSGVASGSYTALNGSGIIASGQAFWVHANAASPVLTATQSVKSSNNATFVRSAGLSNELTISLFGGGNKDVTKVRFKEDATEEFDSRYDGYKLKNVGIHNLSSLTPQGMDVSINTLPFTQEERKVLLNLRDVNPGGYSISFDDISSFDNQDIVLKDKYTDKELQLSDGISYDFNITADSLSFGKDRFELRFAVQKTITSTVTDQLMQKTLKLYPNPVSSEILTIEGDLSGYKLMTIFDNRGRKVHARPIQSETISEIDMSGLKKGMYFVHLEGEKGNTVHKILKN